MHLYCSLALPLVFHGCSGSALSRNPNLSLKRSSSHDLFQERVVKIFGSSGTFATDFESALVFTDENKNHRDFLTSHSLRNLREKVYNLLRVSGDAPPDKQLVEKIINTLLVFRLVHIASQMVETVIMNQSGQRVSGRLILIGGHHYMDLAKVILVEIYIYPGTHYSSLDFLLDLNNIEKIVSFCEENQLNDDCSSAILRSIEALFFARLIEPANKQSIDSRVDFSWKPLHECMEFFKKILACTNSEKRAFFGDKMSKYLEILPQSLEPSNYVTNNSWYAMEFKWKEIFDLMQPISNLPTPSC